MKLIYIANVRIPTEMAHGLQIMKTCEAFSKLKTESQKLKVELIVPRKFSISELGKKNPFEYYKVEKNFEIKKLFCFDLTPLNRFLGPVSFLIQALSFSIVSAIYIFIQRITGKIQKTDIIYGRDRLDLLFIKKPFIFEVHKLHKTLDVHIAKRASKIIVITQELKKDLITRGINENKIFVASDAVDLNLFDVKITQDECKKELGLPIDKKIILYTGHLYKWKGVETLALSSRYLTPNYLIVIVGGIKWYLSDFRKFVDKNNLKNVLVLGHKNYSLIPKYLRAADCLVLTGTNSSETSSAHTSPMKMFEYMTSKNPIVASNLCSFKEVLDEDNSIFVEPDNPESMAIGIKKALNDLELSKSISEQAFQDVQRYTWNNRARTIIRFINDADMQI